jgi:hypothetical protein
MQLAAQPISGEESSLNTQNRPLTKSLVSLAFWTIFALNYLYLDRLITVATNDKFRLGIVVLGLCLLVIVVYLKLRKNTILAATVIALAGIALISAWVNHIGLIQLLAFLRIPLTVYLVYNLVSVYLLNEKRAEFVLRFLFVIAAFQFPLIALQRFAYPLLPARFKLTTSLVDFGMGSFGGDTSMAFALVGLVILILFEPRIGSLVKRKWLLAGWLSLTVLFSNSQIQHVTIVLIWFAYILTNLRAKTIVIVSAVTIISTGLLFVISQSSLMTFPFLQNTIKKVSELSNAFEEDVDYEIFLEGGHARDAAVAYYLRQPIKWIGDGPGTVYDTSSRERSVGGWGHIFTFYPELGLLGLLISLLVFFIIAFPIHITRSHIRIKVSWVGFLMFIAVCLVAIVKYPMGDSGILFTYCLLLIAAQVLGTESQSHYSAVDRYSPKIPSIVG